MSVLTVRIASFVRESLSNGPGVRAVVFFQGCERRCPKCHNPQTWALDGGTVVSLEWLWKQLYSPHLDGLTISGGEPLLQPEAALWLIRKAHAHGLNTWMYTGFTIEEIVSAGRLDMIEPVAEVDALVDGPYVDSLKDISLEYRGSRNQRIIMNPSKHIRGYAVGA